MQDGYTQSGAGPSDMRVASDDLQHGRQRRGADENPSGRTRMVRRSMGDGGPMKIELDNEMARHRDSKAMRMKHLEDHYQR